MNQSAIFFSYAGFNSIPFLQIEIFSLFQFQKKLSVLFLRAHSQCFNGKRKKMKEMIENLGKFFILTLGPFDSKRSDSKNPTTMKMKISGTHFDGFQSQTNRQR